MTDVRLNGVLVDSRLKHGDDWQVGHVCAALAKAGYHVVSEGQAVVDDEVFGVESADDVAWADGNLYRLRPLTDESPTP